MVRELPKERDLHSLDQQGNILVKCVFVAARCILVHRVRCSCQSSIAASGRSIRSWMGSRPSTGVKYPNMSNV